MTDSREREQADHRPASSHRTPSEIAEDERGPIGGDGEKHARAIQANNGPVEKVSEPEEKSPQIRNTTPRNRD